MSERPVDACCVLSAYDMSKDFKPARFRSAISHHYHIFIRRLLVWTQCRRCPAAAAHRCSTRAESWRPRFVVPHSMALLDSVAMSTCELFARLLVLNHPLTSKSHSHTSGG